jgi:hypothetical protein
MLQVAEAGRVDLTAPVTTRLPDLAVAGPVVASGRSCGRGAWCLQVTKSAM